MVDDETWFAVQSRFTTRGPQPRSAIANGTKYVLSGIARCQCGGSIVCTRVRVSGGSPCIKTYSCHRNHQRGSAVCPITIHQPIEEVRSLLFDHLRDHGPGDRATKSGQALGGVAGARSRGWWSGAIVASKGYTRPP